VTCWGRHGLTIAALLVAVVLVGCGGGTRAESGRTLRLLASSDVDFLDPGRTYYAAGWQVAYATQRPLYSYAPGDLHHPLPDLAAAAPRVSADHKTIVVRLRRGVRFSPPVNREVTSRDVAYAMERAFSANVGGPYTAYFADLVGAPAKPTRGVRPIAGITTPDATTIVFRLHRPTAATFTAALVMPITAPVPPEYARRFDAASPSTYNTHVVASGPYMVRNDRAGATVGYHPGTSIQLVRNPNWNPATDRRPAKLDAIEIRTNATDQAVAARQVLAGSHLVLQADPPASVLADLVRSHSRQYTQVPAAGFRYVPMNTTIAPFDRVDVRRAVLAAFDREAARRARGGPITGALPTHFLPPGTPGFEEAGGYAGPGLDFLSPRTPRGDLALAHRYMRRAGFPSGRYTGSQTFLMVGLASEPDRTQAEVVKEQFEKLGFHIRLRLLADDVAIVDWCQVPARRVAMCAGLLWSLDFADPEPLLEPAFAGFAIQPQGNPNLAQLRDPAIDRAMRRAALLSGEARLRAWAAIDRAVTDQAPGIPFLWDRSTLIRARDVRGVANAYFHGWDLAYTDVV
jgi:peptide/nickel transport system substrate-binding protein